MARRKAMSGLAAAGAVAGGLLLATGWAVYYFGLSPVDTCLDAGGAWNDSQRTCICPEAWQVATPRGSCEASTAWRAAWASAIVTGRCRGLTRTGGFPWRAAYEVRFEVESVVAGTVEGGALSLSYRPSGALLICTGGAPDAAVVIVGHRTDETGRPEVFDGDIFPIRAGPGAARRTVERRPTGLARFAVQDAVQARQGWGAIPLEDFPFSLSGAWRNPEAGPPD